MTTAQPRPLLRAAITAVEHYAPPGVYANAWLAERLRTSEEWIRSRTGIDERHLAPTGGTSDLIVPAAQRCLAARGMPAAGVDCIVVATMTPDHPIPATAAIVQQKLGAVNAWGFDVDAACSSFLYALVVAARFIETGAARNVLLCGGDRMSSVVDPEDRATAVVLADGAGAALIEPIHDDAVGILDHVCHMDGSGQPFLYVPAGGSVRPASAESVRRRQHYLVQDGPAVFKAAIIGMAAVTEELAKRNGLTLDDVDWFVPHQANARIIDGVAKRLGLPANRALVNITRFGNTGSATIPIALSEAASAGRFRYGERLVLAAFGAGFTAASVYLRWATRTGAS